MESRLDNFEVQPNLWSEFFKNPKRRFRFRTKRSEAAAMSRTNQEKVRNAVSVLKDAIQFIIGWCFWVFVWESILKDAIQFILGWRFWGFVWEALQETDLKIQGVCAFVSLILGILTEGWTEGAHDGLRIVASILLGVVVTASSKLIETLSEEGGDDETPFQFKEIKKILLNLLSICLNLVRGPIALELKLTILGRRKDHVLDCIEKLFRAESVYTEQRGLTNQVKMLTLVLKFMFDATAIGLFSCNGCFDVAINLRDLITSIDLYLGSDYAARLVPAVRYWLPDLIRALASRNPLQENM